MKAATRARWGRAAPLAVLAIAAALVAARSPSPERLDLARAWCAPSAARPLGCGEGGVDLLAVVSHAEVRGVLLASSVALLGFAIGTPLGAASALGRGRLERGVLRACDLLQAFPTFLLALVVLSAVRSPNRLHIGAVFALTAWAPFARLALVQTRVIRDLAFVEAARALGAGRIEVLLRHVVPNVLGVAAVQLGATGGAIVVSEAALGFVGLGPRDGVSLGTVLEQGVAAMLRAPHVLLVGASAVFLTSAAMLLAGRALDAAAPGARESGSAGPT
jgi:peptide/nickel transport system permease protein